jgi:hypothetical protein
MVPLSNILNERSTTFSLNETLERVEREARETISQTTQTTPYQNQENNVGTSIELTQIKQALLDMRQQIDMIVSALDESSPKTEPVPPSPTVSNFTHSTSQFTPQIPEIVYVAEQTPASKKFSKPKYINGSQIIEGIFNGYQMIGSDGKCYDVSENYASKSKMVEGDRLKLTITQAGKFFYKQVGPVKRKSIVGELSQDPQGNWVVIADMTPYRILSATVTFHRARQGDQVVIIVPDRGPASWGAVKTFLK